MREVWIENMLKIADPVISALYDEKLHKLLPQYLNPDREKFSYLEAVGRTLTGIAPWLELDEVPDNEVKVQEYFRAKVLKGIDHLVDPSSPDYTPFFEEDQTLVDAAFLCQALLRAPEKIVKELKPVTRERLILELKRTRKIIPYYSNWILFSAMVEAGLCVLGAADYDLLRVVGAMRQLEDWYKGDGIYGDGPPFCFDYYNSFVIHPFYLELAELFAPISEEISYYQKRLRERSRRYAAIQERQISPEGTYPIVGRSICYRFGNLQLLGLAAVKGLLPDQVAAGQVRCGMDAVMNRTMACDGMFDDSGWLTAGVVGRQPELAEFYLSIGSMYMCLAFFTPLGAPVTHPFWQEADQDWTNKKIWGGKTGTIDHDANVREV